MDVQIENRPKGARTFTRDAAERARQAGGLIRRHRMAAAVLAILVLGLAAYFITGALNSTGEAFVTAPATRGNIENTVTALGNLQPRNYVDVGAQATGQLKKLYVNIGDTVKQGQLLAEIDPQVASAKVAVDEGNLANLRAQQNDRQAQLALANANFERQKRLLAAGATAASNYDAAEQAAQSAAAQLNAIKAQIAASQSQLDGDKVTLGYTKIYAPMSGTVVSVSIKQGQTINSVQQAPTILQIADLTKMTVWTQVSEADVPKLKVGMPAYFTTLGQPGKRWTGVLQQIQPTPTITNNVVLYTATFDVANPDNVLMTQMTAQVFFITAEAKNAVLVPISALHQRRARRGGTETAGQAQTKRRGGLAPWEAGEKNAIVLVKGADGKIERRAVSVGVSNRVSAQILSGLDAGEQVVTGRETTQGSSSNNSGNRGGRMGGPRFGRL
ncbi:MAG: efflux RND transporter periplasmic adaptor subunit [Alphaproteobacteria bacterium]|nr:efflux RND transporter periplasmic adaptor subunit [Alphaproteobacteria bacterium]MBN9577803.1 efflux RND transporter periplasmic adaptor subunit [Alphaproteobacteria bacterium]